MQKKKSLKTRKIYVKEPVQKNSKEDYPVAY